MFNGSHVAARRKFSKKFARFGARIVERERESFAKKAVWIETSKTAATHMLDRLDHAVSCVLPYALEKGVTDFSLG